MSKPDEAPVRGRSTRSTLARKSIALSPHAHHQIGADRDRHPQSSRGTLVTVPFRVTCCNLPPITSNEKIFHQM